MSCNHITIVNGKKRAKAVTSREEFLRLRNSPAHLDWLRLARNGKKKAKLQLLQFNYSAHYPSGLVAGNKLISKAFMFDIDDKETFEAITPQLLANPDKYGLLMLERSVNKGGHAIFRRSLGRTILEEQVRIANELHCEMDSNAHDVNRVVFATSASEEDLLFLSDELFADKFDKAEVEKESREVMDREKNGEELIPAGAHSGNAHYKPWEDFGQSAKATEPIAKEQKVKDAEAVTEEQHTDDAEVATDVPTDYKGIPYSEIIDAYWKLYNDGQKPCEGDRNAKTYELAFNLRHICGFNERWLNAIIPTYDNMPLVEKQQAIHNACNARQSSMTIRLRETLELVKRNHNYDANVVAALDEATEDDFTYYADKLPTLPLGLRDSVAAVGPHLAMPALFSTFPAIGALATKVMLSVHDFPNTLNLITYIAGDFASGKGSMDTLVNQWMEYVKDMDKMYLAQEQDYIQKKKAAKNSKTQPEEPNNPIRFLTLNNTVANLAERLANTQGMHAFSFTPEADAVAAKWKSAMSDFSVMLRQSYDASTFEREAKSVDAVRVHIEHLRWNVVMCGTPDALYRVVTNYTDGFLSRMAIARTPDNTFAPLGEKPYQMTDEMAQNIRIVSHILPYFEGVMRLEKLEQVGRAWLEKVRYESMKNNDKVLARGRIRTCVTAQRMVGCVVLCATVEELIRKCGGISQAEDKLRRDSRCWLKIAEQLAEDESILSCFDIFADYMLENMMMYFHDKMEAAFNTENYTGVVHGYKTKNKTIYASLAKQFSLSDAYAQAIKLKGSKVTSQSVRHMLYMWERQGLVMKQDKENFVKIS